MRECPAGAHAAPGKRIITHNTAIRARVIDFAGRAMYEKCARFGRADNYARLRLREIANCVSIARARLLGNAREERTLFMISEVIFHNLWQLWE